MTETKYDLFDEITKKENIEKAYFDIVEKFDLDSKSFRYKGVDGISLNDIDTNSEEIIETARKEMIGFKKAQPAYKNYIPKKNGNKRVVFIYPVKERIKAEAIFRVLMPIFDEYFSGYLYSYRSSHPSYYAARSAVRRYKRHYGKNFILVTDISDYSDTIDHNNLIKKIHDFGLDNKTIKLLNLFIKSETIEQGRIQKQSKGILSGTPLCSILSNLYIDDFDKWAGKYVSFYRRVGDDIIAMDKDETKIDKLKNELAEYTKKLKIKTNEEKTKIIKDTEDFNFLGYHFSDSKIGFDKSSYKRIIISWEELIFSKRCRTIGEKVRYIKKVIKDKKFGLDNNLNQIINQKLLVDDTKQIKKISEDFFKIITKYLFGSYTQKNRRLVKKYLKDVEINSLFKYYKKIKFNIK
jgi:hypothetical protein